MDLILRILSAQETGSLDLPRIVSIRLDLSPEFLRVQHDRSAPGLDRSRLGLSSRFGRSTAYRRLLSTIST